MNEPQRIYCATRKNSCGFSLVSFAKPGTSRSAGVGLLGPFECLASPKTFQPDGAGRIQPGWSVGVVAHGSLVWARPSDRPPRIRCQPRWLPTTKAVCPDFRRARSVGCEVDHVDAESGVGRGRLAISAD